MVTYIGQKWCKIPPTLVTSSSPIELDILCREFGDLLHHGYRPHQGCRTRHVQFGYSYDYFWQCIYYIWWTGSWLSAGTHEPYMYTAIGAVQLNLWPLWVDHWRCNYNYCTSQYSPLQLTWNIIRSNLQYIAILLQLCISVMDCLVMFSQFLTYTLKLLCVES